MRQIYYWQRGWESGWQRRRELFPQGQSSRLSTAWFVRSRAGVTEICTFLFSLVNLCCGNSRKSTHQRSRPTPQTFFLTEGAGTAVPSSLLRPLANNLCVLGSPRLPILGPPEGASLCFICVRREGSRAVGRRKGGRISVP